MKHWFFALGAILLSCQGWAESITEWDSNYRSMCLKAAEDTWYFENFRSLPDYTHALEIHGGEEFADFLLKNASKETLVKLDSFQRLDAFGNPPTQYFQGLGKFSATTLRYIVIADDIQRRFSLPENAKIVEIGAGFGGQCFILSQLQPFSDYYIYDLPEAEKLIEKMTRTLGMEHVTCMPIESALKEENLDLVISNYAFSECGRATQLDYFERVIKKSTRGYMIYNQLSSLVYGLDSLSPDEFVSLLKANGMNPQIHSEPLNKEVNNYLIVWDRNE